MEASNVLHVGNAIWRGASAEKSTKGMEEDLGTQTSSEQSDPTLPSAYTVCNSTVLTMCTSYFSGCCGQTLDKTT